MAKRERQILTEFLQLYKDLTCLWDVESEYYKNKKKRYQAWGLLAGKLRELEPKATIMTARKRIDSLRHGYRREVRRMKLSKQMSPKSSSTYTPNLWYFNLLKFIDNNEEQCTSGIDTLNSDEESQENEPSIVRPKTRFATKQIKSPGGIGLLEKKKLKLYDTAKLLLQQEDVKHNPFGLYVGEQLTQVSKFQRHVAEKLISEIIFLGRTRKLSIDSKIEISKDISTHSNYSHLKTPSPDYI
ncbi:uncharacterized protein LOC115447411 [Manduca sexta]|uniref:uncharacterized protein LOC115447411 n=1 Tax=Manduca sexta TaxID=7130 RepID=UPI00188FCD49|nr:uncharacterized protein LOC115447411 [Manduca sexta]